MIRPNSIGELFVSCTEALEHDCDEEIEHSNSYNEDKDREVEVRQPVATLAGPVFVEIFEFLAVHAEYHALSVFQGDSALGKTVQLQPSKRLVFELERLDV